MIISHTCDAIVGTIEFMFCHMVSVHGYSVGLLPGPVVSEKVWEQQGRLLFSQQPGNKKRME